MKNNPKSSKSALHLSNIVINDEYGTPRELLDEVCNKYNIFPKIDVAATFENRKFKRYISSEQNALSYEWNEDFFMNPPYSKVKDFMKKAYEQHRKHNVNGLILVYSKTDTKWWHEFVENKAEYHFVKGRIKFLDHNNKTTGQAPYPSVWIIYRKGIFR